MTLMQCYLPPIKLIYLKKNITDFLMLTLTYLSKLQAYRLNLSNTISLMESLDKISGQCSVVLVDPV